MYPLVVLCGGKASRLGSIAKNTPKSLIEINNRPFLSYVLDNFINQGVKDIYLCLGHLASNYESYVQENIQAGVNYNLSYDDSNFRGTGGAIKKVSGKIDGPFFVTYGDSYLDVNLEELTKKFKKNNGPLMTIFKNNGLYDKSNCKIIDGKLLYLKNKPLQDMNYIDYGLSIFYPEHFDDMPCDFDLSVIQEKYSSNKLMQHYIVKNRFYEIGSIEGLKEFNEHIKTF